MAARAGDRHARDELVRESLRLVALRAHHLGLRGEDLDEAMQSGTLGLIAAVDRFDPDRGCRLATYAWPWITAAIRVRARTESPLGTVDVAVPEETIEPPDDVLPALAHRHYGSPPSFVCATAWGSRPALHAPGRRWPCVSVSRSPKCAPTRLGR